MLALTLWPTWAWFVIHGSKDVENRSWTNQRVLDLIRTGERFAIHAGLHHTRREYAETLAVATGVEPQHVLPAFEDIVTGAVIGTARIRQQWSPQQWKPGHEQRWHFLTEWGFQLVDRKPLVKPIPVKGARGFWEWKLEGP